MQVCRNWTSNAVFRDTPLPEIEEWCLKAVDAFQDLLTVMHLTGGGPGRGTEIGSFLFRNTSARRRSLVLTHDITDVYEDPLEER